MATSKNSAKKTTKPVSKSGAKRPAAKKASTKKSSKAHAVKSFRVAPNDSFLSFKVSRQTLYWTILVVVIIIFQMLILKAQYDVVEANDALLRQSELRAQTLYKTE